MDLPTAAAFYWSATEDPNRVVDLGTFTVNPNGELVPGDGSDPISLVGDVSDGYTPDNLLQWAAENGVITPEDWQRDGHTWDQGNEQPRPDISSFVEPSPASHDGRPPWEDYVAHTMQHDADDRPGFVREQQWNDWIKFREEAGNDLLDSIAQGNPLSTLPPSRLERLGLISEGFRQLFIPDGVDRNSDGFLFRSTDADSTEGSVNDRTAAAKSMLDSLMDSIDRIRRNRLDGSDNS